MKQKSKRFFKDAQGNYGKLGDAVLVFSSNQSGLPEKKVVMFITTKLAYLVSEKQFHSKKDSNRFNPDAYYGEIIKRKPENIVLDKKSCFNASRLLWKEVALMQRISELENTVEALIVDKS